MEALQATLGTLQVGDPTSAHNLTVFPLMANGSGVEDPGYLTLDEALATGRFKIREHEIPTVPTLVAENALDVAVFLLDGEELVGARQDRVINLSILVPAQTKLDIPVSCVEAGRWHDVSPMFASSARSQVAFSRARRTRHVSLSMLLSDGGVRASDQGAVWADMDTLAHAMGVRPATGAMREVFERRALDIEQYAERIRPLDRQVGACFAVNGRVTGCDLFDSPRTLARLLPKLAQSYAADAIARARSGSRSPEASAVTSFLQAVGRCEPLSFKALGEGEDWRLSAPGVAGGALFARDRVIHLCAFALDEEEHAPHMESASRRRMRWSARGREE